MPTTVELPQAGSVQLWRTPTTDDKDDPTDRTFKDAVQDKTTFYRLSAPQWDIASEESYQLKDDFRIIAEHAEDIARLIGAEVTILEYGPGASGKVLAIMRVVSGSCYYIGVDMHRPFLEHTIAKVSEQSHGVLASGIECDFQSFPEIISKITGPKVIISFGSNLFNHPNPVEQLRPIAKSMSVGDKIYLSIDCHGPEDEKKITDTYTCDEFMKFIQGTLDQVEGYKPEQWELTSGLEEGFNWRHSFFLQAKEDVRIKDELYEKESKIEFFQCYKSSIDIVASVCSQLDLISEPVFEKDYTKMIHFLITKIDPKASTT